MSVTYQRKFEAGISCFALNSKNSILGLGLSNGTALFKKRKSDVLEFYEEEGQESFLKNFFRRMAEADGENQGRNYRYYTRGFY